MSDVALAAPLPGNQGLLGFAGLTPLTQSVGEAAPSTNAALPALFPLASPAAFWGLLKAPCGLAPPPPPPAGLTPGPLLLKRGSDAGALAPALDHRSSFTIPAFNLTSRDLINTDDLEGPDPAFDGFGELADEAQLGGLPTEEELLLPLCDPGPRRGSGLVHLASLHPGALRGAAEPPHAQQVAAIQGQLQAQEARDRAARQAAAAAWPGGAASVPAPAPAPGLHLRIKVGRSASQRAVERGHDRVPQPTSPTEADGDTGSPDLSRSSSLGSLKRRLEGAELDDPGSARSKRSTPASDSDRELTPRSWAPGASRRGTAASRFAGEGAAGPTRGAGAPRARARAAPPPAARPAASSSTSSGDEEMVEVVRAAGAPTTSAYKGEDAARAYDVAALACKGMDAQINFRAGDYAQPLADIKALARSGGEPAVDEVVAYVRRRSSAFSRGRSRFRGVSGHNGRWEARIGSFAGRKNGRSAKTNFPVVDYDAEVAGFEAWLRKTAGATEGPAAVEAAEGYTLPPDRETSAEERKRHAVIYADALRRALRKPGGGK
eukprot:scaffold1.g5219.t1